MCFAQHWSFFTFHDQFFLELGYKVYGTSSRDPRVTRLVTVLPVQLRHRHLRLRRNSVRAGVRSVRGPDAQVQGGLWTSTVSLENYRNLLVLIFIVFLTLRMYFFVYSVTLTFIWFTFFLKVISFCPLTSFLFVSRSILINFLTFKNLNSYFLFHWYFKEF